MQDGYESINVYRFLAGLAKEEDALTVLDFASPQTREIMQKSYHEIQINVRINSVR